MKLVYDPHDTVERLERALNALGAEYPLIESGAAPSDAVRVVYEPIPEGARRDYRIVRDGDEVVVQYADLSCALRATGGLLAGIGKEGGVEEYTTFETFGIMLDCSRNAVMRVDHFKKWLRRLALLGFDTAMLYTEDTYALPGEPAFGYQRGAYTADELREIDAYAGQLGIEMIPCIQTLGHLAQILKWHEYKDVRDTPNILLAGADETYQLIDKMLAHWNDVFVSPRIHIGMDEADALGRGAFLDRFGYRDAFTIFNEHLARVVELCGQYGLEPMIWSDMYFRLGSANGDYYDREAKVPEEVAAAIPKEVQLVYWDYYHREEDFYTDFVERHRALGFEPIMASGVWTWHSLWHAANYTEPKAGACVRACAAANVKEIFFTLWGDDGAMCDYDSAMEGLAYVAELAYGDAIDEDTLSARFGAICNGDYAASRTAGQLSLFDAEGTDADLPVWAWPVLWDDPLLGLFWNSKKSPERDVWAVALARYRDLADELRVCADEHPNNGAGDLKHAWLLAELLARKVDLRLRLEDAYSAKDKAGLGKISEKIPGVLRILDALDASWRKIWLAHNKPFGLEVVQIRIAGLRRRFQELDSRIGELLEGRIERIDELENLPEQGPSVPPKYRSVATACWPGP